MIQPLELDYAEPTQLAKAMRLTSRDTEELQQFTAYLQLQRQVLRNHQVLFEAKRGWWRKALDKCADLTTAKEFLEGTLEGLVAESDVLVSKADALSELKQELLINRNAVDARVKEYDREIEAVQGKLAGLTEKLTSGQNITEQEQEGLDQLRVQLTQYRTEVQHEHTNRRRTESSIQLIDAKIKTYAGVTSGARALIQDYTELIERMIDRVTALNIEALEDYNGNRRIEF